MAEIYLQEKDAAEIPDYFIKLLEEKGDFDIIGKLYLGIDYGSGMLELNSEFFPSNDELAKKYLIKSAENGNINSAWLLGKYYKNYCGGDKNESEKWYKKVFKNYQSTLPTNDIKILHHLEQMYTYGQGTEIDRLKAKELAEKWATLFPAECLVEELKWH